MSDRIIVDDLIVTQPTPEHRERILESWRRDLEDARAAIAAIPPFAVRIEAPSEVIAELGRRLPVARAVRADLPAQVAHWSGRGIRIDRDDELPARTVRVHMSDGTSRLEKL